MTKDEMKDKISFALKDPILQQGFEIICKENAELDCQMNRNKYCYSCANVTDRCFRNEIGCPCTKYKSYKDENAELEKENVELRKVAEFQQSSNMDTHFENKKLKEGLAVGSTFNKALNSMNKYLEEERDKYRNMVFDQREQLTKAKEIIKDYLTIVKGSHTTVCGVPEENRTINVLQLNEEAEQFIKDMEI